MQFLAPLSLAFAALSIPILIFYMLKLRRREMLVSSTLLWQRLLRDREANTPWQRLRRNLLLLLQLLILALMTLALARPFLPVPAIASGSVVILLDGSASMQATDVEPSRFDAARQVAREIIAGLGLGDTITLITVTPQPTVLASRITDRSVLRRALEEATPSNGSADWETACTLAAASLAGSEQAQVVILSDGAITAPLPPLPGEVRFVRIGAKSENQAIGALAIREGKSGLQAFLRVDNLGDAAVEIPVEFRADGILFDVQILPIPANSSTGLTLDNLPYDLTTLGARLVTNDPLVLDDTAWAIRSHSATQRVLLVSSGNLFLERALEILPGIELTRLAPDQPLPSEPYDLIVTDGPVSPTLSTGNLWILGPYGESATVFSDTTITRVDEEDPILRHVDLDNVHVRQAWAVNPPPGARVLVDAAGGPLLFVSERPEGRLAALTFQLQDSDLPLQIAFPILTANLTHWLLPWNGAGETVVVQPGDPIPLRPPPDTARVIVTTANGDRHTVEITESPPTFVHTEALGVYQAAYFGEDDSLLRSDLFVVNLRDPDESNIRPGEGVWVGQTEVAVATQEEEGQREFWPWLAGMALGVLGIEWWVYQKGGRGR